MKDFMSLQIVDGQQHLNKPEIKRRQQSERQEQQTLINWFKFKYPNELLFAIPNGGSRNLVEAVNLKKSGVVPGIPDLMLATARVPWHGMFIEMKRADKGARTSQPQKQIGSLLQDKGYLSIVSNGWDAARILIEGYMNGEPWTA